MKKIIFLLFAFFSIGTTFAYQTDQGQFSRGFTMPFNYSGYLYIGQQFTPSQSQISAIKLVKGQDTGNPTSDIEIQILTDNNNTKGDLVCRSVLTNSERKAISNWSTFIVKLDDCSVPVLSGSKYWIFVKGSTTPSTTDYFSLASAFQKYGSGLQLYGGPTTYTYDSNYDLAFMTLYGDSTKQTQTKTDEEWTTILTSGIYYGFTLSFTLFIFSYIIFITIKKIFSGKN